MEKKREQAAAALISIYVGADKKPWPLSRDVVTIGRAKGCDIVLEAPDVSSLHCLVWAFQGGYQVRDCSSRSGTQVNRSAWTKRTRSSRTRAAAMASISGDASTAVTSVA